MARTLYIVAYDISDDRRLAKVHYFLKNFSTGGQKSVYECFLSQTELERVKNGLLKLIHPFEDRIHIFALDGRSKTHTLGIALEPKDPDYFYIG